MKNITSEGYTFLGIYKLAPSSTPHYHFNPLAELHQVKD